MGFHKSQVLFYLLSAFMLGVFVFSFSDAGIKIVLISSVVGIAVLALGFRDKYFMLAGFLILAFSAGGARFIDSDPGGKLIDRAGQNIILRGYVDGEPDISGNIQRLVLSSSGDRILVTTNSYPRYKPGQYIEAEGELELPQNFTEFDYVTYLRKDGIRTVLFYPDLRSYAGSLELSFTSKLKLYIYKYIFTAKNAFQNSINISIPEPNASFINGILLGSRQNIPDDLEEAFKKTGTAHILAISGYNIMIISWAVIGGLIYFFRRRTAFWISVVVISLFVILTGASASVVRAGIMGLLLSFANGYGRLYDPKNSIILAGAVMVWFNPYILVFDVGFQLSFAAVIGLIYLYPYLNSKLKISDLGGFKELSLMTISAQLAVLPLILFYFGNFPLISLPANILILPFIPGAMLSGFIAGLAGLAYQPLGEAVGYIAWAITSYQIEIIRFLA